MANGIDVVYTYDNANQLTKIEYKNGVTLLGDLIYTYDTAGRRTATTGSYARTTLPVATTANAAYNLANQLTSWNSQALPYDLNGNLTTDPTNGNKTYVWDARNRLKEIKQGATTVATFQYDPLGRRTSKVVNGATTNFVYDGLNPVQERDQTNAIKADLLTGLGIDEFLRRTENPATTPTPRHFMSDALNSTIALARDDKTLATTYTYEAYGEVSSTGEASTNPFQYTGRENDGTGLYYYRARYYNPITKHWTAEDPIGLEGGINAFEYVASGPVDATDPLGLMPFPLPVPPPPVPGPIPIPGNPGIGGGIGGIGGTGSGSGIGSGSGASSGTGAGVGTTNGNGDECQKKYGTNQPRKRGRQDPIILQPYFPGRKCDGSCEPCKGPTVFPQGDHFHAIEFTQNPQDCCCIPYRRHVN